ncbi:MAG: PAS domain S-box protein [Dehalococcoidia bacterium]|nr:PAS domain S-box protein [Dehalococcoidia bacterium]
MDEITETADRSLGSLLASVTGDSPGPASAAQRPEKRSKHYRILAESDTDFIWVMDMDFNVGSVTASAWRFLGYDGEDPDPEWWTGRLLTPETYSLCQEVFPEILRYARRHPRDSSRSWTLEMEFIRRDGTTVPVETTVSLMYGQDGSPCGMVCVARDRTQPRREQELFRTLADNSPIGVYILQNGRFRFVNHQLQEYMKYSQAELIGAEAMSFVLPEDRDRVRENARAMLKGERFEPYEFRFTCKDGEIRWVMELVSSVQHNNGRATLGTFMDVTERKRSEEELRRSESQLRLLTQRMLEIQEMERGRFARDLHDQLGQDLVFLKMQAESLARNLGDVPRLQEKAMEIANLADRLKTTSSRIAASIGPGILDGLGLVRAVEWCAEDFERRTGISCPVDTPIADLNVGQSTATAAYRILQEALTNVWRHASASQVEVKLEKEGDWVTLTVADNGVGISAGLLSRKSTLGFLGMYERARLAGGGLTVNSAPGQGTRIVVRLPLGDAEPKRSARGLGGGR